MREVEHLLRVDGVVDVGEELAEVVGLVFDEVQFGGTLFLVELALFFVAFFGGLEFVLEFELPGDESALGLAELLELLSEFGQAILHLNLLPEAEHNRTTHGPETYLLYSI
jgi:hypothetical protein